MEFPIIMLTEGDINIYAFAKLSDIETTSRELLKKGVFNSTNVYDCNNEVFNIANVKEIGYNGWIKGWHPFYKGTSIKVKFDFDLIKKISLEEFKKIILERVEKHDENIETSLQNLDYFRKEIPRCNSAQEIINLFL